MCPGRVRYLPLGMSALLDAFDRWGPRAVAGTAAAAVLLLVLAAFVVAVAHTSASGVAYSGAAGILVCLLVLALSSLRADR